MSCIIQVSECCCGGRLKDVVLNHAFELDLELVISILKDVAAAMAYLYQLAQPLGHQPLCSTRASLIGFHLCFQARMSDESHFAAHSDL